MGSFHSHSRPLLYPLPLSLKLTFCCCVPFFPRALNCIGLQSVLYSLSPSQSNDLNTVQMVVSLPVSQGSQGSTSRACLR